MEIKYQLCFTFISIAEMLTTAVYLDNKTLKNVVVRLQGKK